MQIPGFFIPMRAISGTSIEVVSATSFEEKKFPPSCRGGLCAIRCFCVDPDQSMPNSLRRPAWSFASGSDSPTACVCVWFIRTRHVNLLVFYALHCVLAYHSLASMLYDWRLRLLGAAVLPSFTTLYSASPVLSDGFWQCCLNDLGLPCCKYG